MLLFLMMPYSGPELTGSRSSRYLTSAVKVNVIGHWVGKKTVLKLLTKEGDIREPLGWTLTLTHNLQVHRITLKNDEVFTALHSARQETISALVDSHTTSRK